MKTVDIIALTAGIKRNLSSSLVVARPIFYFKDGLDKKDELDHNTKYFASIDGGTVTSFALNDSSMVGGNSQDVVFRTVQDFGNSIVDYSKYSLKVTLTDILRQLDNDVSEVLQIMKAGHLHLMLMIMMMYFLMLGGMQMIPLPQEILQVLLDMHIMIIRQQKQISLMVFLGTKILNPLTARVDFLNLLL